MSKKSLKLIVVVIALVCFGGIVQASSISSPLTLDDLLNLPIEQLKAELPKFDIAEVNLACAEGLAGSEDLDKKARLETLDKWTQHIRRETERCLPQFYRDRAYYYNSLPYYKILMLVTVLHQDFGVGYNMDLVNSGIMYDFTTTKFKCVIKRCVCSRAASRQADRELRVNARFGRCDRQTARLSVKVGWLQRAPVCTVGFIDREIQH